MRTHGAEVKIGELLSPRGAWDSIEAQSTILRNAPTLDDLTKCWLVLQPQIWTKILSSSVLTCQDIPKLRIREFCTAFVRQSVLEEVISPLAQNASLGEWGSSRADSSSFRRKSCGTGHFLPELYDPNNKRDIFRRLAFADERTASHSTQCRKKDLTNANFLAA